MFKSIKFINSQYDRVNKVYIYEYHLVDDDFECCLNISFNDLGGSLASGAIISSAIEYKKRGLDVIRNVYLLTDYIKKEWYRGDAIFMEFFAKNIMDTAVVKGEVIVDLMNDVYPGVKDLYEKLNPFK